MHHWPMLLRYFVTPGHPWPAHAEASKPGIADILGSIGKRSSLGPFAPPLPSGSDAAMSKAAVPGMAWVKALGMPRLSNEQTRIFLGAGCEPAARNVWGRLWWNCTRRADSSIWIQLIPGNRRFARLRLSCLSLVSGVLSTSAARRGLPA